MKLCMIGTGYVGLVSGVCFSDLGNNVICVDKDINKINLLKKGKIPIYEPGLSELVLKNYKNKRLTFSSDLKTSIKNSDIIFICVGTPTKKGGSSADLTQIYNVAKELSLSINRFKIIITKSTVPVTTGDEIEKILSKKNSKNKFAVVSNPEFLREGEAIRDFTYPDRIVIGSNDKKSNKILKNLYAPLISKGAQYLHTSRRASELIKYASNAFLATKITFVNELANLCEKTDINIEDISIGMGLDKRIGSRFLRAGPAYGGSCFPKDTQALVRIAQEHGASSRIVEAVIEVNEAQKARMIKKIRSALGGNERGKKLAVLGLTFKPETDDMRDAPSLAILPKLIENGCQINAHDPRGIDEAKSLLPSEIQYHDDIYSSVNNADAVVLMTEWNMYRNLDMDVIKEKLKQPVFIDLRNVYEPDAMRSLGFEYHCIGRLKQYE